MSLQYSWGAGGVCFKETACPCSDGNGDHHPLLDTNMLTLLASFILFALLLPFAQSDVSSTPCNPQCDQGPLTCFSYSLLFASSTPSNNDLTECSYVDATPDIALECYYDSSGDFDFADCTSSGGDMCTFSFYDCCPVSARCFNQGGRRRRAKTIAPPVVVDLQDEYDLLEDEWQPW